MGLLRRFQPILPRSSLLTIYKTFIRSQLYYVDVMYRSQLNYVDVLYGQAYNSSFHNSNLKGIVNLFSCDN